MLIELKLVNSDFSPKEKLFSKHSTVKFAYSKEKEKQKMIYQLNKPRQIYCVYILTA